MSFWPALGLAWVFAACSAGSPSANRGGSGGSGVAGSGGNGVGGNGVAGSSVAGSGGGGTSGTGAGGAPFGGSAGVAGGSASGSAGVSGGSAGSAGIGGGGTGGVGGSGVGGGSAGSSAGSAGSGTAGSTATGFFKADFETDTVGMQPAGFGNFLDYQANIMNPSSSGELAVTDSTHVHGGSKAVHMHGSGNPAFLTYTLPSGTNHLYLRAWVYLSRQLGANPDAQANHETLMGINGNPGDVNNQARFGDIKGTIGVNDSKTDDISPLMAQWHMPPSIPATTWSCVEVAFFGDTANNEMHAWVNGTDVLDVTTPSQWQNKVNGASWLTGKFTQAIFGWQSFSSYTADVWMDDIVLSNSAIGCN
ncbi:MAG TPA: hypothetical protein VGI10_21335 [Polyangiaceae bacterium]